MKKVFCNFLVIMMVAMMGGFVACSSDDHEDPFIKVNGLESTSIVFEASSGIGYKQTVRVTSNVGWTISGIPSWLSVSPSNGNGDVSIDIYPKAENEEDAQDRSATLVVSSGETTAYIVVTQGTDLDADAYVTPTNIISLYNGIAFDCEYGENVSYYYRGYMEKADVGTMTDNEVIAVLEEKFDRHNPDDDEIAAFGGLDQGIEYMVYTVGYNKKGKRGVLTKTEVSTKTLKSNEPYAWIGDVTMDATNWYWSVTKSATCASYYMITTEDFSFALASDVYQAWCIDYYIRQGWISEFLNDGDWYQAKSGSLIAIMTWGLDKKENFANAISWKYASASSSVAQRIQSKGDSSTKIDRNYPIIGKDKLTVYRRR